MNLDVNELFTARQMLREGAGLDEVAEILEKTPAAVDRMLWAWFGASAGLPTPGSRAQVAA